MFTESCLYAATNGFKQENTDQKIEKSAPIKVTCPTRTLQQRISTVEALRDVIFSNFGTKQTTRLEHINEFPTIDRSFYELIKKLAIINSLKCKFDKMNRPSHEIILTTKNKNYISKEGINGYTTKSIG